MTIYNPYFNGVLVTLLFYYNYNSVWSYNIMIHLWASTINSFLQSSSAAAGAVCVLNCHSMRWREKVIGSLEVDHVTGKCMWVGWLRRLPYHQNIEMSTACIGIRATSCHQNATSMDHIIAWKYTFEYRIWIYSVVAANLAPEWALCVMKAVMRGGVAVAQMRRWNCQASCSSQLQDTLPHAALYHSLWL